MAKPFQPTPHPVYPAMSPAEAAAAGQQKWLWFNQRREERIAQEKRDPLRFFYEPPIWRVCDALLGFPWVDAAWAEAMRQHLGFQRPVRFLTILGGQRGSKTQYAVTRTLRLLLTRHGSRAWVFHSTLKMSRDYHQTEFYRYLPANLKQADIKSKETYIAYKRKTGFSDETFVLPPDDAGRMSDCTFKTYEAPAIEGANLDIVVLDELTGQSGHADIAETIPLRVSERNGCILKPFTPVDGYSETVRMDLDGAQVMKESVAFVLPKDGGPALLYAALGFNHPDQLEELYQAEKHQRAAFQPQCVPENCDAWLAETRNSEPGTRNSINAGQPPIPAGREFETVPRVLKCIDPDQRKAVVFFHSADNPFGNPKNVYSTILAQNREPWFVRERFHGVAHKTVAARFTKFKRAVHVIPPADVPPEGTRYHVVDPCSGRNLFMHWWIVTPSHCVLYREWPSGFYIPGVGVPGPWAVPGKRPDGDRGPAQKSFGWGLRDYKRELARLEGWKDAEKPKREDQSEKEWLDAWDETNGAKEIIEEREIDSRFASTPRMEKDRPVTLLTEFEDIGVWFKLTAGDDIESGLALVDDALSYDDTKEVSFFNQPRMLVSADCVNTIYALETWTGLTKEGRRDLEGATKDPIDLLRYFFLRPRPYLGDPVEIAPTEERNFY